GVPESRGLIDGRTRLEIDDSEAKIENVHGGLPVGQLQAVLDGSSTLLGDILRHERLYESYPFLDHSIRVDVLPANAKYRGMYGNGAISIHPDVLENALMGDTDELRTILLHEAQHAIQDHEGWTPGGNAEMFQDPEVKEKWNRTRSEMRNFVKGIDL